MTRYHRLVRYVAPFLGALLFSASIGGVVLGGYAAVQEDLGLCGQPAIVVTAPDEAKPATIHESPAPNLPRLTYEELTEEEQKAFEEALDSPLNEGEIRGEFAHEKEFSGGVVVSYEGREYYGAVETMDECVAVSSYVLPSGAAGVGLSVGLFALSYLLGRRRE